MIILSLGLFTISFAETKYNNSSVSTSPSKNDKIFIREYTYNASEDDSKNSSRNKAISQLKSILSEEVGTHIESSLDIKDTSKKGVSTSYVKSEINSLSASITKLKILDEKWNGVTYYVKASVKINEEQTMMLLIEAIKAKASKKDIKRLNKILKEQNGHLDKSYSKIQQLQKKLVLQEVKNQASKSELADTKKLLDKLQLEKIKYDKKIVKQKSEIDKIKNIIRKNESNAYNTLISGMTPYEVKKMVGKPRSIASCSSRTYYNYGRLWVIIRTGIVSGWIKLDEWNGACSAYKGVISAKERSFPNG
jgi:septal ring factor EnvC (AmiA/AmiB activator)